MSHGGIEKVTLYLCAKGAADAIAFYERAFGAVERSRLPWQDGRLGHAEITIGETVVMLADEFPELGVLSPATLGGNSCSMVMYVEEVDAAFQRAVDAGATVERPVSDAPPGRGGWLRDPFGHRWNLLRVNPTFDPSTAHESGGAPATSQPSLSPAIPLPFQLSRLMSSLWVPQAIYTAAALGIADALADGPRTSDVVADTVGAHPGALHRLLNALVALELCSVTADGAFELTPLGGCLRSGTRDSVRSWALLMGSPMCWTSWGRLVDVVRSGESVPQLDGWESSFDFRQTHPAEGAVFDHAMVELTRHLAGAVAVAYDWSGIRTLVDVGGGFGALLPAILAANPELRGAVFDQPQCGDGARRLFEKTRIADRCEFVGGDFFASVAPAGADAYLLKSVIHDWDDARSRTILGNVRAAMGPASRLLIVEPIVPDRPGPSAYDRMIAGTDLNMMVMTGGKERTEAEFRALLDAAALRVTRIVPTAATMSIIEARRG